VYDNQNLTATVRKFSTETTGAAKTINKKERGLIDHPSVPNLGKGSWYMFNNQPLEDVFKQLEDMFKVDIVYSKQDIAKSYFIGSFNIAESLDDVLKQIAIANNLKVTRKNNKVIISR
jgi:transmembrane sensor